MQRRFGYFFTLFALEGHRDPLKSHPFSSIWTESASRKDVIMLYLIYSVVCHPVMSYLVFTQTALYLLQHKDLTNFFYIIPDTTGGFVQNEKSLRGLFGTISPRSLFSSPLNAQLFFLFVFWNGQPSGRERSSAGWKPRTITGPLCQTLFAAA